MPAVVKHNNKARHTLDSQTRIANVRLSAFKNTDVSRETRKKATDFRECGGAVVVELRECFVVPG